MPFTNVAFGPVTIALITIVFEEAWLEAKARGLVLGDEDAAREVMVSTILTAVENGERLPVRLKELALKAVVVGQR